MVQTALVRAVQHQTIGMAQRVYQDQTTIHRAPTHHSVHPTRDFRARIKSVCARIAAISGMEPIVVKY